MTNCLKCGNEKNYRDYGKYFCSLCQKNETISFAEWEELLVPKKLEQLSDKHFLKLQSQAEIIFKDYSELKILKISPGILKTKRIVFVNCPKLTKLEIISSELEAIDLSQLPNLAELNLSGNHLTTINLKHNPILTDLNLRNNFDLKEIIGLEKPTCLQTIGISGDYMNDLLKKKKNYETILKEIDKIKEAREEIKNQKEELEAKTKELKEEKKLLELQIHKEQQRKKELQEQLEELNQLNDELLSERESSEEEVKDLKQKLIQKDQNITQLIQQAKAKEQTILKTQKDLKYYQELSKKNAQPNLQEKQKLEAEIDKLNKQIKKLRTVSNKNDTVQEVSTQKSLSNWISKNGQNILYGFIILSGLLLIGGVVSVLKGK